MIAPRPSFFAPVVAVVIAGCGVFNQQTDLLVKVVDARTGQGIPGAVVEADYQQHRTGPTGQTRFTLRPNTYDLSVEHPAFLPLNTTVVLVPGALAMKTVGLYPRPHGPQPGPGPQPAPSGAPASPGPSPSPGATPKPGPSPLPRPTPVARRAVLYGHVTDEQGTRLPNVLVLAESEWGIPLGHARSDAYGEYRIGKLPPGQGARVTAIADGYKSITRQVVPVDEYRLDFTGYYALRREGTPAPEPGGPTMIKLEGRVEDTMGRPVDGAIVKAESDNVRFPFSQMAIARGGRYEMKVPLEVTLRFGATKVGHRPVTFVERVERPMFGGSARIDFSGARALDPVPVFEGG